uniref:Uncharacterized protein n=1 Tax=Octopus bimaculoides TaxID=37653 RepID=A0A0L8GD73_OCTBM
MVGGRRLKHPYMCAKVDLHLYSCEGSNITDIFQSVRTPIYFTTASSVTRQLEEVTFLEPFEKVGKYVYLTTFNNNDDDDDDNDDEDDNNNNNNDDDDDDEHVC